VRTYKEILENARKIQQTSKPFISYTRNTTWKGQPCIICGSKIGIHEVKGRYVAGDKETNDLMFICGICLEKHLEKDFEADME